MSLKKMIKSAHKILVPKEHGAWAMLILPYFIGVVITDGLSTRTILGLISVLLLFLSRSPLIILLKEKFLNSHHGLSRRELWLSFGFPAAIGFGIFFWLLIRYSLWELLVIGSIGLIFFTFHTWLTFRRKKRSIFGDLVGIFMLTLSAPLAVCISQGQLTHLAFVLWLLNALYFSTSVFHVRMRVRASVLRESLISSRVKLPLVKNCLAYLTILMLTITILTFADWIPVLVPLAFVPIIAHTAWSIITLHSKIKIIRVGLVQIGLSLIFAALMIISYKL